MNSLEQFQLYYEDLPPNKPNRVGRTLAKMSQSKTTQPEATKTPKAKYSKTRGEHFKDIVIAVLVTGIIAFVGGMVFQSKQQSAIDTAVKAVTPSASAQAPVKK